MFSSHGQIFVCNRNHNLRYSRSILGKTKAAELLGSTATRNKRSKCYTSKQDDEGKRELKSHIIDMVKRRQFQRKAITLKFVQRTAKARLAELGTLGFDLKQKGKPLRCSRSWCYRLLILSGNTSRKRGLIYLCQSEVAFQEQHGVDACMDLCQAMLPRFERSAQLIFKKSDRGQPLRFLKRSC